MAATINWQHWSTGWTDPASSPRGNIVGIGPEDGNSRQRSCITVNLSALSATEKRNKLEISLSATVASRFGHGSGKDTIYARMTDKGPTKGYYSIQGSTLDTKSCNVNHGNSEISPSWTFDISSFSKSAKTVYIYIYGSTVGDGIYGQYKIYQGGVNEVTAPDVTAVTTGSITTPSGQIYKQTDSVSVAWNKGSDGTNNPLTGYNAYLKYGSGPTTNSYDLIKTGLTSTSTTFSISGAIRGISVYVGVCALGSNGNGQIQTKQIGVINSLPGAPSFTASGSVLNTNNKITYTVTAGKDSDSQTLTLYYSLNNGRKQKFTSPLEISTSTSGVVSGSNSIVFYTYDTKEYSAASSTHSFTATFAPVIGSITMNHTSIADMNNNTSSLASGAKITFTMSSGTPKTVKLYVRSGSSTSLSGDGTLVSGNLYSYNESSKTIDIPSIVAITSITAGHYYQFAFKVNDGSADSELTAWQTYKRKPLAPRLPTYSSYNNHAKSDYGATAKSNYYKDQVTINFTCPSASAGYAKIEKVVITATYGNSSKDYSANYGVTSLAMDLKQVNPNVSTTFKFKITDVAGQTNTADIKVNSNILTLIKSSELAFGGNSVNVSNENLKPMTNTEDFKVAHPIAQASGTQTIVYKYNIKVGNNSRNLTTTEYSKDSSSTTDQLVIVIPAATINSIANELAADTNSAFDTVITITAADGFNVTKTLNSVIFKVNFTEPPYFLATNPSFGIKHEYYTSPPSLSTSSGTEVTSSSNLNVRMVNSGEGIIFMLPKAVDPNNDIKEYRIYLARNDFTGTGNILSSDSVNYSQELIRIPYQTLLNGVKDSSSTGYFYYRYTASTYSKNEYFYFKLQVVDETGNTSKAIICPNYIIGCRTMAPTFSAGNIKVDRNGSKVTLNYNFVVTDLGGSATKDGWSRDFYDDYPNFERTIDNYEPEAYLVIEIAPDQNFRESETIVSSRIYSSNSWNCQADFTSKTTVFNNFAESHAKIFMRFTFTVSYGLKNSDYQNATISSEPQVYTYFGSVPTVAHRAHRVGINTNSLGQDDVLVVENYQGTRYVVFRGTDATNAANSYEVRIDLLEGKVYGYKTQGETKQMYLKIDGATIDGGTW